MDVTIRACREDDLPKLEWFGEFSAHRLIFAEALDLQRRGEAAMLVAEAAGFPVGQAWLDCRKRSDGDCPIVWAVRVLDPLRGAGIGSRLMMALEAIARDRGATRLELAVGKGDAAARGFYQRLGWCVVRERNGIHRYVRPDGQAVETALDEWIMTKALAQSSS